MIEYQYVAFRAIDKPVSDKNLEYMHRQSSRAEIDQWSFENEYHYSDFRGDALEMLRRGYDIHLLYANFGTRTLMIRIRTVRSSSMHWQSILMKNRYESSPIKPARAAVCVLTRTTKMPIIWSSWEM